MDELLALQKNLGVSFNNPPLLEKALVHSSFINENPQLNLESNERLEFLGDAVLGMTVAEKLYHDLPHASEGEMTKLRATVVRRDALARIARTISLGDFLYLGKGEETNGGRNKPANLASALEAVIAAVFLDQGWVVAREVILRLVRQEMEIAANQNTSIDYKSQLQELVQASSQSTPTYHIIKEIGPDHDKTFTVEVRIGATVLGKGSGKNKKTAEAEAARTALKQFLFTP